MKFIKKFILIAILFFSLSIVNALESCRPQYQCGAWSECKSGFTSRVCSDVNCGEKDITERSFCDNLGCVPKLECGAWGSCTFTQKTNDLIEGKILFDGYRYRTCRDTNEPPCIPAFQQEGFCQEENQLLMSPIEKCGRSVLGLYDPLSKTKLAEMDLDSLLQNRLDLAFTQGETKYCPSCYNAIKDAEETDIDCGGPDCRSCKKERYLFYALAIVLLWFGSLIFSFLSIREVIILKKTRMQEGEQTL